MNELQNSYLKIGAFLIFSILIFSSLNSVRFYEASPVIYADVSTYYTYLPAVFIYQDLELTFIENLPASQQKNIWTYETKTEKSALKMTSGLAFLYLPFFLLAHVLAQIFDYIPNGYSVTYSVMLLIASAFYTSLAFYYTTKTLVRYFNLKVSLLTSLLIVFATNLFIYSTSSGAYSHSFNFFLFSFFIWKTIEYYDSPKLRTTIMLGVTFGLIALIRPTNGLVILFFVLFNISSFKDLKLRAQFFLQRHTHLLLLTFFAILVWVPQFLYWKAISGEYFHYSYGDEGFFFNNPRIARGLFGFRKGWLVYTPIMSFALMGIIIMGFAKQVRSAFFLPMILFIPTNIYIILSWWCWWYGGSFGQRAFIDSYAILAIPLAFLIDRALALNKRMKYIILPVFVFLTYLNLFQSWQYTHGILHYSDMTKSAYLRIWGKINKPHDLNCLTKRPDYEIAKREGKDKSYYGDCFGRILLTPQEASDPFVSNRKGILQIHENNYLSIRYKEKQIGKTLKIALDGDDIYTVGFFNKRKLVHQKLFYVSNKSGIYLYEYNLDKAIRFDEIKVFPSGGDKNYFFSHLTIE